MRMDQDMKNECPKNGPTGFGLFKHLTPDAAGGHFLTPTNVDSKRSRPPLRRCLTMNDSDVEMNSPGQDSPYSLLCAANGLRGQTHSSPMPISGNEENERQPNSRGSSFKRPDHLNTPVFHAQFKKRRAANSSENTHKPLSSIQDNCNSMPRNNFEETIKNAVQKADQQPDLIGDFSKIHALPMVIGKHQDLKSISPQTLADLMKGAFKETVNGFTVIDCRYPYEYNGGHIQGAINIYTTPGILEKFFKENIIQTETLKQVIIFHCEFSSERGPSLYRFMRSVDRAQNHYPRLHHPEIYILNGGYKAFFESYGNLCEPQCYLPMNADKEACRKFRAICKNVNRDFKATNPISRSSLKF